MLMHYFRHDSDFHLIESLPQHTTMQCKKLQKACNYKNLPTKQYKMCKKKWSGFTLFKTNTMTDIFQQKKIQGINVKFSQRLHFLQNCKHKIVNVNGLT